MSALFVGFAEYRYGAQSDHHRHAEEDLDVGTSRDLVDWAAFDKACVCSCWCESNRREESGGESKVNVHIRMFVSSLSGQIDQRSRKRE